MHLQVACALGSLLGVIHSLSGLREVVPDQRNLILAMGVSECINDIGLALLLTIIAAAISATGSFRAAAHPERSGPAGLGGMRRTESTGCCWRWPRRSSSRTSSTAQATRRSCT